MSENEKIPPQDAIQDLYRGLGCTLYALAKTDGRLQSEETETLRLLLMNDPNGLVALEAFDIQDQYQVLTEDAYAYAFRRFAAHRMVLNESIKKHFIQCMEQLAEAYDGVSKKENEILRRFRRDITHL
jgi:uncharacterized tellurite resistance protein B-like protein